MPYYYRRWRRPRWRRRRIWRRRFRPAFRWRFYRRKRPVRTFKRKLKTLNIKEWQPSVIRKCTVKGLYCLLQCSRWTVTRNWAQYEASIVPEHEYGGGGFSILRFNLDALYEQHNLVRNIWTKSNKYLPLVRYMGMQFKIYRPEDVDLVVKIQNCYPMTATQLLYTGTQPAVAMLSKNSYKIPSKKTKRGGKPYKKINIPPPSQMRNGWFFQKDLAKTGLVLITTTACSFDHYYLSTKATSNNITLLTLNTTIFKSLFFKNTSTVGYVPKFQFYLYATENGSEKPKYKELIWLGNTIEFQHGVTVDSINKTDATNKITDYLSNRKYWGNPLHPDYVNKQRKVWVAKLPPAQLITSANFEQEANNITELFQELIEEVRYNPQKDTGKDSQIYLLPNWKDEQGWDPPQNQKLILSGFPSWLNVWGFIDYQLKLAEVTQIASHYICVIKSPFFEPKKEAYIFLDREFYEGNSPFLDHRTPIDNLNWYPMVHYQQKSLDILGQSGPGTVKMNGKESVEAKCLYKFRFKFGGCVPPMEKVTDPTEQPNFPVPNNITEPNSLQSPTTPIESFLWSFDERRGYLTKKATDRITQDWDTKKTVFTDATTTGTDLPIQFPQKEEDQTSDEETQEETLYEQLIKHRTKQQQLRQRIKLLLNKLQNLE